MRRPFKARRGSVIVLFALLLLVHPWEPFALPGAPADAKSAAFRSSPIEVVDATGKKISLARLPERIVVVGQGPFMPMHLLYLFPEAKDRLAGHEEKFKVANDFLPLVDPSFPAKTALATNPGPEHVAALNPDLVITKGNVPTPLGSSLSRLGIPVLHFGMENPDQFLKDVRTTGILFGNPNRADEIAQFYQARLELLAKGLEGVSEEQKPRVLVMGYNERGGKAAVQVPGRSWTQTIQTVMAGGNPVWLDSSLSGEGWTVINFEQVASWDPDKIFIIPSFRLDRREVLKSFKEDRQWRMLKAARTNDMLLFPSDIFGWDSPEPRWILGMMWLATRIFPERFSHIDMKEEVYRFFTAMFGLERAAVDDAIMPLVMLEGR
jgi:iron complex transport system substrate-binding protein